mmetsp:Transcript_42141/g.101597  ORF Transcript_42141/g.101597 Transcript_42141/m.101597 type:complete len:246 (-) Transcript_42141:454-1191(-)
MSLEVGVLGAPGKKMRSCMPTREPRRRTRASEDSSETPPVWLPAASTKNTCLSSVLPSTIDTSSPSTVPLPRNANFPLIRTEKSPLTPAAAPPHALQVAEARWSAPARTAVDTLGLRALPLVSVVIIFEAYRTIGRSVDRGSTHITSLRLDSHPTTSPSPPPLRSSTLTNIRSSDTFHALTLSPKRRTHCPAMSAAELLFSFPPGCAPAGSTAATKPLTVCISPALSVLGSSCLGSAAPARIGCG